MSKASEWVMARRHADTLEPPPIKDTDGKVIACVDDDGILYLTDKFWNPAEALQLARWILDTFGEPEEGRDDG